MDKSKKKEMHDVLLIDWLNNLVDLAYSNIELDFDDVELMQSSGLKDKNDVEIFEGDIVVTKSGKVYIIIRSKTGLYKAVEKNKDEIYYLTLADVCDSLKVAGNIYENSELLED